MKSPVSPPRVVPAPPAWSRELFTVGTTGTNGKTTTTTWIAAALARLARPVVRATTVGYYLDDEMLDLPKNYEGFVATMKTCVDRGGKFAAIELTSEALAQGFGRAWPCTVGVFTNLTHDHLDAHGSAEHYLASKAQLFVSLPRGGTAVLNGCDPAAALLAEVMPEGVRVLTYGVPSRGAPFRPLDVVATRVTTSWEGTRIACAGGPDLPGEIVVRAIGDVYAENALAALLGAVAAGVPAELAKDALAVAAPPPGRFEVVHERPYVVVDYAHSPDALMRTIGAARRLAPAKLTAVFGAGGHRDKEKRKPMGESARAADCVVLTSDNPRDEDPAAIARSIALGLSGHPSVRVELDRKKAIAIALQNASPDDVVVICGKGHETEQIISGKKRHFSDAEVVRELFSAT